MVEIDFYLPYHEPDIVTILILSSLLLLLNMVNAILNMLIFCGLLGQVFIGVAWGTPGGKWLDQDTENVIVKLGYLGLILLVYEGGLETNFRSLKANAFLSVAVAITGICFPIGLSFVLKFLVDATPLQAFAAGAALCSTSLGTTFTVLSASGLSTTRLGTVLTSAAMMDDVIGLVMVQIISNLGESSDSFDAVTVIRPLAVSVGLGAAVPLTCWLAVRPLTVLLNKVRISNPNGVVNMVCRKSHTAFIIHTLILVGLVTGATYAGTSNLFAAYLAGASISWWDSAVPHPELPVKDASGDLSSSSIDNGRPVPDIGLMRPPNRSDMGSDPEDEEVPKEHLESIDDNGTGVFQRYYANIVKCILKPFFFASIGFSIPITKMFGGEVVWRGIVYTILMLLGKIVTGIWLIRVAVSWPKFYVPKRLRSVITASVSCLIWVYGKPRNSAKGTTGSAGSHELQIQRGRAEGGSGDGTGRTTQRTAEQSPGADNPALSPSPSQPSVAPKINSPLSLYPAAILGSAMTARGEIGFLIASLAETTGLFAPSFGPHSGSSEIYLVVTWAIVMCTIIGPLCVGVLVKRVRRLQGEREKNQGGRDPLGIWGVG